LGAGREKRRKAGRATSSDRRAPELASPLGEKSKGSYIREARALGNREGRGRVWGGKPLLLRKRGQLSGRSRGTSLRCLTSKRKKASVAHQQRLLDLGRSEEKTKLQGEERRPVDLCPSWRWGERGNLSTSKNRVT